MVTHLHILFVASHNTTTVQSFNSSCTRTLTETNYPDLFIAWGSKAIQEGDGVVVPIDIGESNETSDAFIVRPTQNLNGDGTISSYRLIGYAIILRPYRRDFAGIFGIARVDIWLE
jgi:hypothetical protein